MAGEFVRVLEGPAAGQEIALEAELELGRSTAQPGQLGGDVDLSRHHARISRGDEGTLMIEDLGSTNGTRVNGGKISAPVPLKVGDRITVGGTTLEVGGVVERAAPTRVVDSPRDDRAQVAARPPAEPPTVVPGPPAAPVVPAVSVPPAASGTPEPAGDDGPPTAVKIMLPLLGLSIVGGTVALVIATASSISDRTTRDRQEVRTIASQVLTGPPEVTCRRLVSPRFLAERYQSAGPPGVAACVSDLGGQTQGTAAISDVEVNGIAAVVQAQTAGGSTPAATLTLTKDQGQWRVDRIIPTS